MKVSVIKVGNRFSPNQRRYLDSRDLCLMPGSVERLVTQLDLATLTNDQCLEREGQPYLVAIEQEHATYLIRLTLPSYKVPEALARLVWLVNSMGTLVNSG